MCLQVTLNKYHTVFLTDDGQVYSCGHGLGGRLGHGDELTRLVCIVHATFTTTTSTTTIYGPLDFVRDYPGEPVSES